MYEYCTKILFTYHLLIIILVIFYQDCDVVNNTLNTLHKVKKFSTMQVRLRAAADAMRMRRGSGYYEKALN